jgi:glycine/D-amino acid oxidase-like deaminating enzyme
VDWVEELIRRYDIECDWHRGGHLALAPDGDTLIALSREADALAQAGFPGHLLNADAVRARLGFGAWPGGLYDPASGTANPYRLGMGLAMAAIAHGAVLVEGAPARIDPGQGPPYVVRTPVGNVSASDVLVAANAWLGDLLPALRGRVKRVFGAVLATDPLPSALAQRLLPGRPAVFEESDRVLHFQKTADGRLVFGGRAAAATAATEEALPRLFREVVPDLGSADRHLTVWRGPLAIVADGLPRVGVTPRGIMWAGGYTGHGVALAVWLGREAARWMAEGTKPHWPSDLPPRWPRPAIGRFRRLRSVSAGAGELS